MPHTLTRVGASSPSGKRARLGHRNTFAGLVLAVCLGAAAAGAAPPPSPDAGLGASAPAPSPRSEESSLREAAVGLAVAAVLGAALAFRPRRRGTPPRNPAVIQTQIILALVGAVVMLVVGASLARAFGTVGAASLVRYRSKIDDPKDAGIMLSCLAIGLASGVGIYVVAAVSTLFILGVVWLLESLEPESYHDFLLKLKVKESARLQDGLEAVLRRNGVKYELRTSSQDDLTYSVRVPLTKRTDKLTDAILALGGKEEMAVEWSDKKPAKVAA
jgi:uncharacterized membrane protein YhiD involved in acid resistance